MKPVLKSPGGKSYRLSFVRSLLADFPCDRFRYWELMVGGGAIFFDVGHRFKQRVISDTNPDIINLYDVVKTDVEGLIAELQCGSYFFLNKNDPATESNYKRIRAWSPPTPIQRAARWLYLTKTCFNGLIRSNLQGQFNTAPGSYINPVICDPDHLRKASRALAGVAIGCPDAIELIPRIPKTVPNFLVVDPPYDSDEENKFTSFYGQFMRDQHASLVRAILETDHRFLYFNRATDFIRDLFVGSGATMLEFPLTHSIQPKYTEGLVESELIVHNLPANAAPAASPPAMVGRDAPTRAWRATNDFRPILLTPSQYEALVAAERQTGIPADEVARGAIRQVVMAATDGSFPS
jgi:DNA adenine methylase